MSDSDLRRDREDAIEVAPDNLIPQVSLQDALDAAEDPAVEEKIREAMELAGVDDPVARATDRGQVSPFPFTSMLTLVVVIVAVSIAYAEGGWVTAGLVAVGATITFGLLFRAAAKSEVTRRV